MAQLPRAANPRFAEAAASYGLLARHAPPACPHWMRGQMLCAAFGDPGPASGLPDALIVAPNQQTAPLIAMIGIPVIEGVPPIVILNDHLLRTPRGDDPARELRSGDSP